MTVKNPDKTLFELYPELKEELDALHAKLKKKGLFGKF
jgi:hypothetical protein